MREYTHLTREQRYMIFRCLSNKMSQAETAKVLGVHKSTISREVSRNRIEPVAACGAPLDDYCPDVAEGLAQGRKVGKVSPRLTPADWSRILWFLENREWSPEQISLYLRRRRTAKGGQVVRPLRVCFKTIYRHIQTDKENGGTLHQFLRCQKKRRKRYGSGAFHELILNRVSIHERPKVVDDRRRIGDFEIDTVYGRGNRAAMLTVVDRNSRHTWARIVPNREATTIARALVRILTPLKGKARTLTADNGREFAAHEEVAEKMGIKFYFADAYASHQRGTNENTNGLIRQYFPKGTDFAKVSPAALRGVLKKLNDRPRKCLGMKTPAEVMFGIKPAIPPVALG